MSSDSRHRRTLLICAVAVALLLAAATAPRWWPTPDSPAAAPETSSPARATPTDGVLVTEARPARRAGGVQPEPPSAVRLPDGVTVPIRAVSTRSDGVLDVPRDIRIAGWWRGGSHVGDPLGSTLVAAHIDSTTQGLGPFAALLGVRRDQRFVLTSATLRQTFKATSLRLLRQGTLERQSWLYSPMGGRRLVLVTCAPPYVRERGGYQNLAVVTAVPVSPARRR